MSGTSLLDEPEQPLKQVIEAAIAQAPEKQRLSSGLTDREELFCQAYFKHHDAMRAAQEAGYKITSPKAARIKAWKLLHSDKIAKRIDELRDVTSLRNNLTADVVVSMIRKIYNESMACGKYSDAVQACKMLGDYLDIFKTRSQTVTNIGIIGDPTAMDKEIRRLASAAGVQLLPGAVDAEFSEVQDKAGEGVGSGGGGDSDGTSSGIVREGDPTP